ncbi:MAG: glycoside hydrolase, partial [Muribaculaceae bacterium]|nr:glycoside hydrolase [Muribaculaceae bacterium]
HGNAVTTPPADLMRDVLPIATAQQDPNKYWNYAFGDAALVADRESGKLLLLAVGGPTSLWNGRYENPNQCVRWYSEDGGSTWTEAQRITYDLLDLFNGEPLYGKIDSHFIGSGRIMQSRYVKVGDYYRVYAVMASQNEGAGGTTRNWVLYSDDFGQNWNVLGGTDVCPVMTGRGDECKAEELPDGSVLIAGRCRTGNRNFNIFRYTDATKAQGKWMDAVLTDMGFGSINACDGEIMILPVVDNQTNEHIYLALQSFPYGGGRNYVSIAYKALRSGLDFATPECFTSFDGRYRISSGSSVYSTMAWQANNKLAFFWEEGSPISGTYLDLSLEEITDGRYTYSEDTGNKVAIEMTKQLLDYRAENDNFESKYVGQPVRSKALFDQAVQTYNETPSYRTYVAANKLQYEGNGLMKVIPEGGYRLTSGHDGVYASMTEPVYLATDGTKLTSTETDDNSTTIFVAKKAESEAAAADDNFMFLNKGTNKYIGVAPGTASTQFTMADTEAEAGHYRVISSESGHSALSATDESANKTYSAIHLAAQRTIVTWTTGAGASQWYIELIDAPAGYEVPEATMPETDDYDFDYEKNQPLKPSAISELKANSRPALYFDLQGRAVVNPKRGIFVTPEGRKVVL